MATELREEGFEKEISQSTPILVDFWAEWCGPCKRLGPVFEELSTQYTGKLRFAKVNVEHSPKLGQKYNISAIPCMILFKNGKEINRITGALSPEMLKKKVDEMLAQAK